jgi:hypothetical protein
MSYTWSILDFWITNHFKLYGPICLPARAAWLTGCSFLYLVGWKAWRARLGTALKEFGIPRPCLDPKFPPKFHYAKRRFSITSKCRHMHGVLNVDEIKN